jgi:hypothetical protein
MLTRLDKPDKKRKEMDGLGVYLDIDYVAISQNGARVNST